MTELFNPHSNEWLSNKFEIYKELRTQEKAYYSEKYKMYVFTRYDDVKFILTNPDIFSSAYGNLICEEEFRFGRTLGASDNPMHEVYKNIVKNAYSKDNIDRILSVVEPKIAALLSAKEEFNISTVIDEISAWVTTEMLNFPCDKEMMKTLIVNVQRHSPMCVSENVISQYAEDFKNLTTDIAFIKKLPATGPGIYKEFIENHPTDIKPVVSLFQGPTISGASSMTGALQFLTLDLYRENVLSKLIKNPSLIPNAINESLRFHASTGRFSRTVMSEITLQGVTLPAGTRVAVCLDAVNRDPAKFENPDEFDLNRDTTGHLAFGYGVHACIALAISKAVMSRYLEILINTLGNYQITTSNNDLKYVMTASGNNDMISNINIKRG